MCGSPASWQGAQKLRYSQGPQNSQRCTPAALCVVGAVAVCGEVGPLPLDRSDRSGLCPPDAPPNADVASAHSTSGSVDGSPNASGLPSFPTVTTPAACRSPDSPVFSRVRATGWTVPVVILQFQKLHLSVSLHTAALRDAADFEELAVDFCDAHELGLELVHVDPQPDRDYPILLGASAFCL